VIVLLRALVRVVAFLLLVLLALLGLAVALAAIAPGVAADFVGLPQVRDAVGGWLGDLERGGRVPVIGLLVALGAVVVGLLLLVGALVPRRERLVTLRSTPHGRLGARRRALAQVARALAEQARGVTEAKVKVKPRRRGGGRLRVTAARPRPVAAKEAKRGVAAELAGLTKPFRLKARIRSRAGARGARTR